MQVSKFMETLLKSYQPKFIAVAAIGTTIAGSLIHLLDKFDSTKAISLVWLSGSLLTDMLIAVALVVCLVSLDYRFFYLTRPNERSTTVVRDPTAWTTSLVVSLEVRYIFILLLI